MKSIIGVRGRSKGRRALEAGEAERVEAAEGIAAGLESRVELIQALIPLGLEAVGEVLQQEVAALTGQRYQRGGGQPGYARWGSQRGSVYLADHKVAIEVPRVRDRGRDQEVPLAAYQSLREPRRADEAALQKVLKGLSCRDYESCVEPVAQTFGLKASSLSRRFKRASARKLSELMERDLSVYDVVAIFLDGKRFGEDEMVIALGITLEGKKVILGFVQTATENEAVCSAFLRGLVERGLKVDSGLLCIIDGAKGLRKAVDKVLGGKAAVQRCQWHKRENVVGYLPAGEQATFRRKLQGAYEQPTYVKAKAALSRVRSELTRLNTSAVGSLDEGLEETLTLHRLGLFKELGRSFKTTNCLENLNGLVAQRTDKVDCWRNSDQKQRWLATALLDIEPRLRLVCGNKQMIRLRTALQMNLKECLEAVA
ncbi:MAG TPA: transposase [Candidatus Acidoferrales bacterium]|nr:transposase [Candidatus Acidoferrales bacterium]